MPRAPLDPHECILTSDFELITRRQNRPDIPNSGNVVFLEPPKKTKNQKTKNAQHENPKKQKKHPPPPQKNRKQKMTKKPNKPKDEL